MKLLDLNLLLYAVNSDSAHHRVAKPWLENALNDDEPVALPWAVLLGFLRIATNKRILPRPLSTAQAMAVMDGWLAQTTVRVLTPGEEHWHGAAPTTAVSHIAIQEALDGKAVDWVEKVRDEQYHK